MSGPAARMADTAMQESLTAPAGGSASKAPGPNKFVVMYALCAGLNSALLGYDIGIFGGAMTFIREEWALSDGQTQAAISIFMVASIVGIAFTSQLADQYGRRAVLGSTSAIFILGSLMMTFAGSYSSLFAGRIVLGIATGIGLAVDPVYISEISPPSVRP